MENLGELGEFSSQSEVRKMSKETLKKRESLIKEMVKKEP
jgi:hypothetical protein